jgi:GntR family transcriptional regulator
MPIYLQLKERIRHEVTTGRLAPGTRLPTVRELAIELMINANTVSRVYSELTKEGYLESRQGSGTYVRKVDSGLREARRDRLHELLKEIVGEALNLGYSRERLVAALNQEIDEAARAGPGALEGQGRPSDPHRPVDKEGKP